MGDSENSIVSKEECYGMIKKFLGSENFTLQHYSVEPWSNHRSGFLGNHMRIRVSFSQKNETISRTITIFMKMLSSDDEYEKYSGIVNKTNVYEKESFIYSTIFEEMTRVSEKIISSFWGKAKKYCRWAPKVLLSRPDLIAMEDLSREGFETLSPRTEMTLDQSLLVMKVLARMHADSIVYEEYEGKRGMILQKYSSILSNEFFINEEGHPGKMAIDASIDCMFYLMDTTLHKLNINENLKKMFKTTVEKMYEFEKPSNKYRNVLCQGDIWPNNVLFKYDKSGQPEEARLVDFQLVRYTPPAHDVMCFLYLSLSNRSRKANMKTLISHYYKYLMEILEERGLDIEKVLPKSEFEESCKEYSLIGKITRVVYFNVIHTTGSPFQSKVSEPNQVYEYLFVDRKSEALFLMENDSYFREKNVEAIDGIIKHCKHTLGALQNV